MSSDSQQQQPSIKYAEEVLGHRACVFFEVKGEAQLKPYMGFVKSYKQEIQEDGSIERTHHLVFEDGDKLDLDLADLHEQDRLWWHGMTKQAPSLATAVAPAEPVQKAQTAMVPVAVAAEAPAQHQPRSTTQEAANSVAIHLHKKQPVVQAPKASAPALTRHQPQSRKQAAAKPVTPERPKKKRGKSHGDNKRESPRPKKKRGMAHRDNKRELPWLDEMENFLVSVPHGRMEKVISAPNAKSVMRQVQKLATGQGIGYQKWPDNVIFYQNIKVDLTFDFEKMLLQAKEYEDKYGADTGHGWLMRHPIMKLQCFQEYKNNIVTEV